MSSRTLTCAGLALSALGSFFATPSQAQLGHVVRAQKISDTSGGFTATLDEQDQFGRSIVNLGDLDGDGISDLLVGAHTDDDGGLDQGSVYVLFLHANGFVKSWQKISDLAGNFAGRLDPGDQFGRAAANLGDLDGDGVIDLAVSANYDDDGGANKGAVYILFLNTDGTVKSSQKISELSGGLPVTLKIHDEFGRSLTNLGDLDGDGVVDLLVGTPEDDEGGTNTGALHVLFLNTNGTVKAYRRISKFTDGLALKPGDWFGFCSANLGDFDGDGVNDVAVGSVLDDDGGVNQGSLWLLMLNADGSVKSSHEIDELEGGFGPLDDIDQFGTSVANIGDLDGDGVTDITVGAVKDDDGGTPGDPDSDVGALYVFFLKSDKTVKSWVKISDESGDLPYSLDKWDWFGSATARLGGSASDGVYNVAAGCRNDDDSGPNRGAIYLLQLNDGTFPVADFTADHTLGVVPLTVQFTDTSGGDTTSWVWNFSDGPQSTQRNPVKTFAATGSYDISLTARGPSGVDTLVRRGHITVVDGPLAGFNASPRQGDCPLAVQFEDLSMGVVTSWSWDFGDGSTSNEPAPVHLYAECGTYDVTLTVAGPSGTHVKSEPGFVIAALQPPVAGFSLAPASGVAPLVVQFADLSSGGITGWSWSFGDGATASTPSTAHTYATPGSYDVSLTVSGPGGIDTHTIVAGVVATLPPPDADFDAAPTTGSEPLAVTFTDQTTGPVSSWSWDFGDGTGSTEASPLHVYDAPGVYTVTLVAGGPGGADARTRTDLVTVLAAPPGADFSAAPLQGEAPLLVQFQDDSALSVSSWSWDFGDGTGSDEQHPAHLYASSGLYTVTLTVNGPGGSDTRVRVDFITVAPPATTADFGATPLSGPAPLTVEFHDASSANVNAWSWTFGDGAGASVRDPQHTYAVPGLYTVALAVTSPSGAAQRVRAGFIEVLEPPPMAAFSLPLPTGVAPFLAHFAESSTGAITERIWDFGDGTSSREAEPSHLYGSPGSYSVTLTVIGQGGSSTLTLPDLVQVLAPAPVAGLAGSPGTGPAPLAVQFSDQSSGIVTAWSWDFGDGASSTTANPQHTYATPGQFTVALTVSGPGGSDTATVVGLVTVQPPAPVAALTATPTSGVAPLTVQFGDLSSGAVTAWSWDFGDGTSSTAANPQHTYATPGQFTVALTVSGPGGSDTATVVGLVTVQPPAPVAALTATPTSGVAPLTVQFGDLSSGAVTAWSWDFGDGTSSTAANPQHTYATPGQFTVALTVSGPGGSDTATVVDLVTVQPPAPVAALTAAPTSGVAPLTVAFGDASSGAVTAWSWDFGDGTSSALASPAHVYATPGTYSVALTVQGPGGTDVELRTGLVSVLHAPPIADFSATPRDGYAPLAVTFADLSSGAIDTWSWDFGDGASAAVPSPTHVFALPGSYSVLLLVEGTGGTSTRQRTIVVRAAPVFADGSFEQQTAGLEPGAPWRVFRGTGTRVRPVTGEPAFPGAGLLLCDLGAEGSANATPPSNPGGAGTPAFALSGLEQSFLFPLDAPHLFFEAAFLRNGPARSTTTNDFMSVDIGDGTTIWNLYFADSFADFPLVSAVHGLPMTAPERVHVDLAALFPAAGASTVLTLRFGVGNHGNGAAPSRGYIDGFRFEPAARADFRNGKGLNPVLYSASPAVIGGQFRVTIDGSLRPSAGFALVLGRQNPLTGTPLFGGELLVVGKRLFSLSLPLRGAPATLTMPMPNDASLVGLRAATQAVLFGGGLILSNAYDLRLGY